MTHNIKNIVKTVMLSITLSVLCISSTTIAQATPDTTETSAPLYYSGDLAVLHDIAVVNGLAQYTQHPELMGIQVWQDGRLTFLMFSGNASIAVLPQSMGNLSELRGLYLSNQSLSELPESIGNLGKLEKLHLDNNHLQTLPVSIGNLSKLNSLYLQNNYLQTLPYTLQNLQHLKTLNISGNKLEETAYGFLPLTELSEFYQ